MRRALSSEALAHSSTRHPWAHDRGLGRRDRPRRRRHRRAPRRPGDDRGPGDERRRVVQANPLLAEAFPEPDFTTELVVVRSERHTVDDTAFAAKTAELAAIGKRTGAVAHAETYFAGGNEALVSDDRHATLVPIRLAEPPEESGERLIEAVRGADGEDGFQVAPRGSFTSDGDFDELSQHDLEGRRGALRSPRGARRARARLRRPRGRLPPARARARLDRRSASRLSSRRGSSSPSSS